MAASARLSTCCLVRTTSISSLTCRARTYEPRRPSVIRRRRLPGRSRTCSDESPPCRSHVTLPAPARSCLPRRRPSRLSSPRWAKTRQPSPSPCSGSSLASAEPNLIRSWPTDIDRLSRTSRPCCCLPALYVRRPLYRH